nr:SMP-30/gluconolactonase/LRE family protein [Nodosilinea nodulosa]
MVAALSNQLPPIFAKAPVAVAPAQTLAEFPVNTFLENIAVAASGDLFVTSYEEGKIYRITPAGAVSDYATIPSSAAGLAFDRQGNLLVAGVAEDKIPTLYRIKDGIAEPVVAIAGAIFLNGMTYLTGDRYLIADSYKGAIWEVDVAAQTAKIWVQHERLARSDANHPFPAVNGIKRYGDMLYATNTQRQQLLRIPIQGDHTAGTPERWLTNVNLDDFAFDVNGTLYATTHVYNSVVSISPAGEVTTIATAAEGVAGSTALAFGRTGADRTRLYVTTNGGMSLPLPTGVEAARVVGLEVGVPGLTLGE